MINKRICDADLPKGCLVAMLAREGQSFVPNGRTILHEGDCLTIIGEGGSLEVLRSDYLTNE